MTSGGGQSEQVNKPQDFNVYGKDIANFGKFKGNDKNDAMRMTNEAANDVKKAYMQLQHEFPDVVLQFEPMPDPQKCGKKREGFFNYQQQLSDWKDMALTQIANEREISTTELIKDSTGRIVANNDSNTQLLVQEMTELQQQIADGTAQIIEEFTTKTGEVIVTIKNAKGEIINAVKTAEGKLMREVQFQGWYGRRMTKFENGQTRETVMETAEKTQRVVRNSAQETQELDALSQKISDVLTNPKQSHTNGAVKAVGAMRDKIMASDLSFEDKKQLLNDLADFSGQVILSSIELTEKQIEIDERIRKSYR